MPERQWTSGQHTVQPDEVEAARVERIDDRTHQGYSAVPDLHLRWEDDRPGWYDPATGRHITRLRANRRHQERETRQDETPCPATGAPARCSSGPPRRDIASVICGRQMHEPRCADTQKTENSVQLPTTQTRNHRNTHHHDDTDLIPDSLPTPAHITGR